MIVKEKGLLAPLYFDNVTGEFNPLFSPGLIIQGRESFLQGIGKIPGIEDGTQGKLALALRVSPVEVSQMLPPRSPSFPVTVEMMDAGNDDSGMFGHGSGYEIARIEIGPNRCSGGRSFTGGRS